MAEEKKGSGRFGGVGGARFGGKDPFFPAGGEFLVELTAIECYESKNPQNKNSVFFKIRGKVLAVAFAPTDYDVETYLKIEEKAPAEGATTLPKGPRAAEPVKMPRPGQYGVQLIDLSHGEIALGDVKNFAAAAYRAKTRAAGGNPDETVNPDTFGDEEIDALYAAHQPCAGVVVALRTANKPTAKGTDFTQHFWDEVEKFTFSYPIQAQVEG
jgi:hypothetical protein